VPTDGGKTVRFTSDAFTADISPDGSQVAFYNIPTEHDNQAKIEVVSVGGASPTVVANALTDIPTLKWAPDGKALQYILTEKGTSNIWEQPLPNGTPRPISKFSSQQILSFAWSRDGQRLAIARGQTRADVVLISNFR